MISEAGKIIDTKLKVRPLNTPKRKRMYYSIEVKPVSRLRQQSRTIFQTACNRQKKDSFMLRSSVQMVTNTNYSINDELTHPTSHSQEFQKGKFKRMIADFQPKETFLPAVPCHRKCSDSYLTIQQSVIYPKNGSNKKCKNNIQFEKQTSRQLISVHELTKRDSVISTQDSNPNLKSLIRKRSKKNVKISDQKEAKQLLKVRKFNKYLGHQLQQFLCKNENSPDFYDIRSSNQSSVKKSISSPRGHVRFDLFTNKSISKHNRYDPLWGSYIQHESQQENPEWGEGKSLNFSKSTNRCPNEPFNKYPIRHNMRMNVPVNCQILKSAATDNN